mmetsp:Transcript_66985/g.178637  ORF Transcript_66985/g.178637 Transcript_66985/m.178637 type:complete len:253 (+) Transcript_66985:306-1064(+)
MLRNRRASSATSHSILPQLAWAWNWEARMVKISFNTSARARFAALFPANWCPLATSEKKSARGKLNWEDTTTVTTSHCLFCRSDRQIISANLGSWMTSGLSRARRYWQTLRATGRSRSSICNATATVASSLFCSKDCRMQLTTMASASLGADTTMMSSGESGLNAVPARRRPPLRSTAVFPCAIARRMVRSTASRWRVGEAVRSNLMVRTLRSWRYTLRIFSRLMPDSARVWSWPGAQMLRSDSKNGSETGT